MTWFTRRGLELVPADMEHLGWVDEMRQAGLNLLVLHVPERTEDLVAYAASPAFARLADQTARAGIDIEWAPHALSYLLPREHFANHPGWFRMDLLGRRVADWNMCPSCSEALQVVALNAAALAAALRPTTHRYYMWSDDGRPWCHCPLCASLSDSEQSLKVANAVLEGVRSVDGDALVSGLAYYNTLQPTAAVQPSPGVFLEYAPIQRCFLHALDDPNCAVNRAELAKLHAVLAGHRAPEASQVLEYWLDESLFWRSAGRPPELPRLPFRREVLERDLELYARLGFRSVVTYGVMLGSAYRGRWGVPPLRDFGEALLAAGAPS